VIISRLHRGSLDHVIATRPSCLRIFLACTGHPTRLVIEGAGLTKSIVGDRLHCCKAALRCVSQPSASGPHEPVNSVGSNPTVHPPRPREVQIGNMLRVTNEGGD
jgi:hypothetical protein